MSKRRRSRKRRRVTPPKAQAARRVINQAVDHTYHQVVPSAAPAPAAQDRMAQPQREQARRAAAAARRAEQLRRGRVQHVLACRRLPHTVTVLTAAAGLAAWGLAALVAWMALPIWPVAVFAGVATLAAVGIAHYAARNVLAAAWRGRTWGAGIVCALWVASAALVGVRWPMLAGLLFAEIVLAGAWWRRHPLVVGPGKAAPATEPATVPEPEAVGDADVVQILQDWAEHVACEGGPVPGSRLTNPEITAYKVGFTLELVRGKQSLAKVRSRLDEIATGLGYHPEKLLFERFTLSEEDEEQRKDEAWKVKFGVVVRNPIARPKFFTGPVVRGGSAEVGLYADGDGRAAWPFWNSAGMRNGAVIGGTRSGKGGVSGVLAVSARATGVLNLLYVDPQGGMSSPEIAARATVVIVGKGSVTRAIEVVEALADGREEYGSARGRSKLMPSAEMPGWGVFLDESHTTFKGQGTAWMEFFSRCLKLGLFGIAFSQYAGLTAFDGNEHLRSSVALNYIALKTQSATSGGLIPGLSRDPVTLPDGRPGYGIFGGSVRSDVPFRADFLPNSDDQLSVEPPLRLGPALDVYPEPAVCALDRRSLIQVLGQPDQDGRWVLSDRANRGRTAAAAARRAAAGTASYFTAIRPLSLVADRNPGPGTVAASAGSTAVAGQLSEYERGVLAAMADGHHRVRDIRQSCGWSRSLVHDVLSELKRKKVVHQPKYGTWLPGDGPNYDGPANRKTA